MRFVTVVGGLLGASLAAWLLIRFGVDRVLGLLAQAGWGIVLVMGFHLIQVLFSALGWRTIAGDTSPRPSVFDFVVLRWVREGINNLLPVAQVGGEFATVALLRRRGVRLVQAAAGTVCDLTMEMVTQILFTIGGLLVLLHLLGRSAVTDEVIGGLGVAVAVGLGFLLAQWFGLARLAERLLIRLSGHFGWKGAGEMQGLHPTLIGLYKNHRAVFWAFVHQSVSWLLGAGEVWLALFFLGHERPLGPCLVIEALGQAVKAAGFVVPAALGVSEGGYVVVGALFGLPPAVSIALALIKRLREIVLGLPALAAWQWLGRNWQNLSATTGERESLPESDTRKGALQEAALDFGDAS